MAERETGAADGAADPTSGADPLEPATGDATSVEAADPLADVRARAHDFSMYALGDGPGWRTDDALQRGWQAAQDRATVLAALDAERARKRTALDFADHLLARAEAAEAAIAAVRAAVDAPLPDALLAQVERLLSRSGADRPAALTLDVLAVVKEHLRAVVAALGTGTADERTADE